MLGEGNITKWEKILCPDFFECAAVLCCYWFYITWWNNNYIHFIAGLTVASQKWKVIHQQRTLNIWTLVAWNSLVEQLTTVSFGFLRVTASPRFRLLKKISLNSKGLKDKRSPSGMTSSRLQLLSRTGRFSWWLLLLANENPSNVWMCSCVCGKEWHRRCVFHSQTFYWSHLNVCHHSQLEGQSVWRENDNSPQQLLMSKRRFFVLHPDKKCFLWIFSSANVSFFSSPFGARAAGLLSEADISIGFIKTINHRA